MSYTDLRDFHTEYMTMTDDGFIVEVEKLGGGTVGEAYTGTWRYVISLANGIVVKRGQDYETGMPQTHEEVAEMLPDVFVPTGSWEIGHNLTGSPREAAETFRTWHEAADAVRDMAREWADTDDESRDEDDESATRADVDAALAHDGCGPEHAENAAWSMTIEESSYHRIEFWIQPASI